MTRDEAIKMVEAMEARGMVSPSGYVDMLVKLDVLKVDEPKGLDETSWKWFSMGISEIAGWARIKRLEGIAVTIEGPEGTRKAFRETAPPYFRYPLKYDGVTINVKERPNTSEPNSYPLDSWTVKVKASERVYVHTFRSVEDGLAELGYSVVPSIEVPPGGEPIGKKRTEQAPPGHDFSDKPKRANLYLRDDAGHFTIPWAKLVPDQ